jgi:biopolymer transport protein ExbD
MASATTDRHGVADQCTPLVQLLLALLLIAWAAAASGAFRRSGFDARPPAPELRLQIEPSGAYALDGRRVDQVKLEAALQQARVQSPDLRLRIAVADGSDYRAFVRALASAQDAGIRNVGSEMR